METRLENKENGKVRMRSVPSGAQFVSIVIPCRNEAGMIERCLQSVLSQEPPPGGMEIIVADGMSDDGTREILEKIAAGRSPVVSSLAAPILHPSSPARDLSEFILHPSPEGPMVPVGSPSTQAGPSPISHLPSSHPNSPVVRVINNPGLIVSTGLNAAIRAAKGDIIVRMDAHTEFAPDYVRQCVELMQKTGADNVGGPARTKPRTYLERAISAAYHSPFSVGGARFHDIGYEGFVDTVTYGCWRKETFERFGYFDEELVRNQDDEHNLRIVRGGGKVWQSPEIKSWYRPRGSLRELFKQYMQYGYWKVRVIQKHKLPASVRHLVPGLFLLFLVLSGICSLFWHDAGVLFVGTVLLYGTADLSASLATATRSSWKLLPLLPLVFPCYHFGYAYGFLCGIWDFVIMGGSPNTKFKLLTR